MMMDPETFVNIHRRDAYEDLCALRDQLVEAVQTYEDRGDNMTDAEYVYDLACLGKLCSFMVNRRLDEPEC